MPKKKSPSNAKCSRQAENLAYKHLCQYSEEMKDFSRIGWMSLCTFTYKVVREMARSGWEKYPLPEIHLKKDKVMAIWNRPEGRFILLWPRTLVERVQVFDEVLNEKRSHDRSRTLVPALLDWLSP